MQHVYMGGQRMKRQMDAIAGALSCLSGVSEMIGRNCSWMWDCLSTNTGTRSLNSELFVARKAPTCVQPGLSLFILEIVQVGIQYGCT